jgi:hypothetical protein
VYDRAGQPDLPLPPIGYRETTIAAR